MVVVGVRKKKCLVTKFESDFQKEPQDIVATKSPRAQTFGAKSQKSAGNKKLFEMKVTRERKEILSSFEQKSSLGSLAQNILQWLSPSHARNFVIHPWRIYPSCGHRDDHFDDGYILYMALNGLRWLGTVVTSHTASLRQAYTPVMSMLQKAVQSTHCTSCNQPADTHCHNAEYSKVLIVRSGSILRGAWSDRDTNDIFAHCSLIFLLSWLQIFQLCLSFWTSSFDMVLFEKFLQEKEKYLKNLPKRLSSQHLHSFVNRAETWYTASTHPSAKYVVTKFLISL